MKKYAKFNENLDMLWDVALDKRLIFLNTKVLRKTLRRYSVQKYFDYIYLKSNKIRVQACCMKDECDFYIFASKMRDYDVIQIKSLISEHTCGLQYEN